MAQSKEAPQQPQKIGLEQSGLLQEVTVKMETMDVQEAHLQDLRALRFREEVPQSIKMDRKREELLAQTGTTPQKRDARLIHNLCL